MIVTRVSNLRPRRLPLVAAVFCHKTATVLNVAGLAVAGNGALRSAREPATSITPKIHLTMRTQATLACLTLALFSPRLEAQTRKVYVLAGQSNIANLANIGPDLSVGCQNLSVPAPNVRYWQPGGTGLVPLGTDAVQPLFEFGQQLASADPNSPIDILMIAQSGSALLWSNALQLAPIYPGVHGAWIDASWWGNPVTLVHQNAQALMQLQMTGTDELHIVWSQGESDALGPVSTPSLTYSNHAQLVFAGFGFYAGRSQYTVHLVSLGGLYEPNDFNDTPVNQIRDAYRIMWQTPLGLIGPPPTIHVAANHYDLPHGDTVHLSQCGYFELARRIADGIAFPIAQPRATGSLQFSHPSGPSGPTDIAVKTNVTLAARPMGTAGQEFFEVRLLNPPTVLAPSQFQVGVLNGVLTVRVFASGATAGNVSIRYVAGRGDPVWQTAPAFGTGVPGRVLEPFVLQ